MNKKRFGLVKWIELFGMIIALFAVCVAVAWGIAEKDLSRMSLFADLMFGFSAFVVSSVTLLITVEFRRRDEKVRHQKVVDDARKFVTENEKEINYIPFCLVANAYNNHHKFVREIYNRFNELNEETQLEVLSSLNYKQTPIQGKRFIVKGIDAVVDYLEKNDLGKHYLYDEAKYFHVAMDHPGEKCDLSSNTAHVMTDYFTPFPKCVLIDGQAQPEGISFLTYLKTFLAFKKSGDKNFALYQSYKPLDELDKAVHFGSCSESTIAYWNMEVVESVVLVLAKEKCSDYYEDDGLFLERGDAQVETFEDRYLSVLMALYNMDRLAGIAHKKPRKPNKPKSKRK